MGIRYTAAVEKHVIRKRLDFLYWRVDQMRKAFYENPSAQTHRAYNDAFIAYGQAAAKYGNLKRVRVANLPKEVANDSVTFFK